MCQAFCRAYPWGIYCQAFYYSAKLLFWQDFSWQWLPWACWTKPMAVNDKILLAHRGLLVCQALGFDDLVFEFR